MPVSRHNAGEVERVPLKSAVSRYSSRDRRYDRRPRRRPAWQPVAVGGLVLAVGLVLIGTTAARLPRGSGPAVRAALREDAAAWVGTAAVGLCLATFAAVAVTGWQAASAALGFVLGGGALALLSAVAVFSTQGAGRRGAPAPNGALSGRRAVGHRPRLAPLRRKHRQARRQPATPTTARTLRTGAVLSSARRPRRTLSVRPRTELTMLVVLSSRHPRAAAVPSRAASPRGGAR